MLKPIYLTSKQEVYLHYYITVYKLWFFVTEEWCKGNLFLVHKEKREWACKVKVKLSLCFFWTETETYLN
jgi:hypothetical protein